MSIFRKNILKSRSDGWKGSKVSIYVPPTAEVMAFALEEGFATTTQLQGESKTPANNQQTPAGQFGEQDWSRNTWN